MTDFTSGFVRFIELTINEHTDKTTTYAVSVKRRRKLVSQAVTICCHSHKTPLALAVQQVLGLLTWHDFLQA